MFHCLLKQIVSIICYIVEKKKKKKIPKPRIQLEQWKSLQQVKSDKSAHNLSFWTKFSATKLRNKWITIIETSTLSRFFSHLSQALHLNKKDAPSKKPFDRIRFPSLGLSKTEKEAAKTRGCTGGARRWNAASPLSNCPRKGD